MDGTRKKILMRSKQKSMELMMNLVSKLSTAEEAVLDTCTGTSATEKAFLQLPDDRRLFRPENDSVCLRMCFCRWWG